MVTERLTLDIKTIDKLDKAKEKNLSSFAKLSLALLFMVVVFLWSYTTNGNVPNNTFLIIGAVFGAYMAMNIGANDVANNVGPAVGSRALTMFWAIVIAAIFEALGSFIAGGDVVKTIKNGIINPALFPSFLEIKNFLTNNSQIRNEHKLIIGEFRSGFFLSFFCFF